MFRNTIGCRTSWTVLVLHLAIGMQPSWAQATPDPNDPTATPTEAASPTDTPPPTPTSTRTPTRNPWFPTRTMTATPTITGTPTVTYTPTRTPTRTPVSTVLCGNGRIFSTYEQCDDGGTLGGDGCSAACRVEPCWSCSGQPSTCTAAPGSIRTVESAGDVGSYSSLAIGTDGLPILSHWDATNKDLRLVHCDDANCDTKSTQVIDADDIVDERSSLTIGADGLPIIAYARTYEALFTATFRLWVARCGDPACSTWTLVQRPAGPYATSTGRLLGIDATIAGDFLPVIVYSATGNPTGAGQHYVLQIEHCSTPNCSLARGPWIIDKTVVHLGRAVVPTFDPQIALATGGQLLSINGRFDSDDVDQGLMLTTCSATNCSSGTYRELVGDTQESTHHAITIGANGFAWISRVPQNGSLQVLKCGDAACSTHSTVTPLAAGSVVGDFDTAMAPDEHLMIAYVDATNRDLRLARCNDLACTSVWTRVIDNVGPTGGQPSLVFDPAGSAVVSYYDGINQDLKVAVVCPVTSGCGNGTVESGETCDDGNLADGDACPSTCLLPTPTLTPSPTITHTPTVSPTSTPSETPTLTPSPTVTQSPTQSATPTETETPTLTATVTPSATPSPTPSSTPLQDCPPVAHDDCFVAESASVAWRTRKDGSKPTLSLSWSGSRAPASPAMTEVPSTYSVCLYDASAGALGLALGSLSPAVDGSCDGSCWSVAGSPEKGYRHSFRKPYASGMLLFERRSDTRGRERIRASLSGDALRRYATTPAESAFSQDPRIMVQIATYANDDNRLQGCWDAVFAAPAQSNEPSRFKDRYRD